jgi:hypothetical protein
MYTNYKTGLRNELIYKRYKSIFYGVLSGVLHSVVNSVLAMYSFFEVFSLY